MNKLEIQTLVSVAIIMFICFFLLLSDFKKQSLIIQDLQNQIALSCNT